MGSTDPWTTILLTSSCYMNTRKNMARTKGRKTGNLETGIGKRLQRRKWKEEEKVRRGVRECVELFSENEQQTKMQARRQGSGIGEQQASPLSSLWNSNSRDRRALGHGGMSTPTARHASMYSS